MAPSPYLSTPPQPQIAHIQDSLLAWWDDGHRDLPWRRTLDPYHVLVSEFMLQQTQVSRVAPKFLAFIERFPTLAALAEAPTAEVIRAWAGLGYNRRAVNLQRLARAVVEEHGGALPAEAAELRALPGIGPYTAAAVASIAFNRPVAAVDTNVRRVITRVVDGPDSARGATGTQQLADALLAQERAGDWNQALMELGALVCLPVPECGRCPLRSVCAAAGTAPQIRERRAAYRANGARPAERFESTTRFYRGRIVEMLRAEPVGTSLAVEQIGARLRLDFTPADRPWLEGLLDGLTRDGLVSRDGDRISLPIG